MRKNIQMQTLFSKIDNKYNIQNIFSFIPWKRAFKLIKYNKHLYQLLDYTKIDMLSFNFLKQIIKPIENCEDYIPILKRILKSSKEQNKNSIFLKDGENDYELNLLCHFLNKNQKFVPQINKIKGNEKMLDKLDKFKIGFNNQFLNYFYDENEFKSEKLKDFCKIYGKKIKEITFKDKIMPKETKYHNCQTLFRYIIDNSSIEKIEDRSYNNKYSMLLELDNFENSIMNDINLGDDFTKTLQDLKSYSIYSDEKNKHNISFNKVLLLLGKKIEDLRITNINYVTPFLSSLKNFQNLMSLSISEFSNKELYNRISLAIKRDSLNKLEMNLNYFSEGISIINRNKNSLKELKIKINFKSKNKIVIVDTLSNIRKLTKLKISAYFQIIDHESLDYLFLPEVDCLKIPLYIENEIIDFNKFFENIPKLKKLKFCNIYIRNPKKIGEIEKNVYSFGQNQNLIRHLKKINFVNGTKDSTLLIINLLNVLMNDNINEIKIEKCSFGEDISFFDLLKTISDYSNLESLSLNNLSFSHVKDIAYDEINDLKKLKKLYIKGIEYEQNNIKILYFIKKISIKAPGLIELGINSQGLNAYTINWILQLIHDFSFLTKINLFDGYISNYSYRENEFIEDKIYWKKIKNYCIID